MPKIVRHDAQMFGVCDTVLLFGVWFRDALTRCRVLDHSDFVPDDPADVEIVEQDAATSRGVTVDR
ncbi:MAG: hypothetical protein Q7V17_13735 [Afipia sp.]|nr:hypothetical protein [Afipia sp.]